MTHMFTSVKYTVEATADSGRVGRVSVSDGVLDLDLGEPGTQANPQANPETLFAAAYAASFQHELAAHAGAQGLDATGSKVTAGVSLGAAGGTGETLAVRLKVSLPAVKDSVAKNLVELARQSCPYSKATKNNIDVLITVS